jgi:hypothetical protein
MMMVVARKAISQRVVAESLFGTMALSRSEKNVKRPVFAVSACRFLIVRTGNAVCACEPDGLLLLSPQAKPVSASKMKSKVRFMFDFMVDFKIFD